MERNLLTPSEIIDLRIIRDRGPDPEDTIPVGGAANPRPWMETLNQTAAGGDTGIMQEWLDDLGF